ncbi:MAG: hypothetical protein U1F98_13205 [Verrucomicrobiota bacterium]
MATSTRPSPEKHTQLPQAGGPAIFQVVPPSVETKIFCSDVAAANRWPSADEVMDQQFVKRSVALVQVTPKSVEMTGAPYRPAATNRLPSAEPATEHQYEMGALACIQVAPEFVEM